MKFIKSIEDELLAGASPDQAIAHAEDRLRHALAARPEHQAEVFETWGAQPMRPDWRLPDLRVTVPHDGDPETVPSASCLRRELGGIPNPTREDIQRAMRACRGGRP